MTEYAEAGKYLAKQYNEVCSMILSITDRMAAEYEELYLLAYRARNTDMPDKNAPKSSPVEGVVVLIEKMRDEMDQRYCMQVAELERKRMDMESIIACAGLSAIESRVFYLRYGMRKRGLRLDEIADMVYYSERQVKRVLERGYGKIGVIL